MDQERTDVCKQELDAVEIYTSFNRNRYKSYIFTISTTTISIFIHVYNNFNQNCATDNKGNACFTVNYVLLHVLMKYWCKLPEDSDNAETCRS